MKKPGDETPDPPGGRAAERLREFLDQRLPPGASPEDLNPEIAGDTPDAGADADVAPPATSKTGSTSAKTPPSAKRPKKSHR